MKYTFNQNGMVALVTILIMSAVVLVVVLSINLASLGELKMGFSDSKGAESLAGAEGCVDEALARVAWDNTYTGGTLNLGGNSCIIGVVGSGDTRTVHVTSTVSSLGGDIYRKVEVGIDMSGNYLTISSWEEK